jgi:hypothetical protein
MTELLMIGGVLGVGMLLISMAPFSRRGGVSTLPRRLNAPAVIRYMAKVAPLATCNRCYGVGLLVRAALRSISGIGPFQSSHYRNVATASAAKRIDRVLILKALGEQVS